MRGETVFRGLRAMNRVVSDVIGLPSLLVYCSRPLCHASVRPATSEAAKELSAARMVPRGDDSDD